MKYKFKKDDIITYNTKLSGNTNFYRPFINALLLTRSKIKILRQVETLYSIEVKSKDSQDEEAFKLLSGWKDLTCHLNASTLDAEFLLDRKKKKLLVKDLL